MSKDFFSNVENARSEIAKRFTEQLSQIESPDELRIVMGAAHTLMMGILDEETKSIRINVDFPKRTGEQWKTFSSPADPRDSQCCECGPESTEKEPGAEDKSPSQVYNDMELKVLRERMRRDYDNLLSRVNSVSEMRGIWHVIKATIRGVIFKQTKTINVKIFPSKNNSKQSVITVDMKQRYEECHSSTNSQN